VPVSFEKMAREEKRKCKRRDEWMSENEQGEQLTKGTIGPLEVGVARAHIPCAATPMFQNMHLGIRLK